MSNFVFAPLAVPGASSTTPFGLNDHGQIVGSYVDASGHTHGFLDTTGRFTTLDAPGASSTVALGVNNLGQVVGNFVDSAGVEHGFVEKLGQFTSIDAPGATATSVTGINDKGQLVGNDTPATAARIRQDIFTEVAGQFSTIAVPGFADGPAAPIGGTYLFADGISDQGWIAITAHNAPGTGSGAAFIDQGGQFTPIQPPGAALPPVVRGISSNGVVVGDFNDSTGAQHGYVDVNGSFTTVDAPGGTWTDVSGINRGGEIVGMSIDSAGQTHGFVAHPGATVPIAPQSVLGRVRPLILAGR